MLLLIRIIITFYSSQIQQKTSMHDKEENSYKIISVFNFFFLLLQFYFHNHNKTPYKLYLIYIIQKQPIQLLVKEMKFITPDFTWQKTANTIMQK